MKTIHATERLYSSEEAVLSLILELTRRVLLQGHDSHFLLLLDLFFLLFVVLHDLQPLSLHQATLLDVKLLFSLRRNPYGQARRINDYQTVFGFTNNDL